MEILVTQTLRPIKLAFLIRPDSRAAFLDAVQICSSMWAGKYFPILPIKTRFNAKFRDEYYCIEKPLEFYTEAIRNYDPDYIVAEMGFETDFVNKIKGDRKVIFSRDLKTSIENGEAKYGIGLDQVLVTLRENEFKYVRTDGIQLLLPVIKQRDLFCSVLFGKMNSVKEPVSQYSAKVDYMITHKIGIDNLAEYYNEKLWFPLKVGTYKLQSFGNPLWTGATALYIIEHNRLNDLINYWNLRALGWEVLPIPVEHFDSPFFQKIMSDQLSEYTSGNNIFDRITVLKGFGIDDAKYDEIKEKLPKPALVNGAPGETKYSFQWWFPRYWASGESLRYDRAASSSVYSEQQTSLIQLDSSKISIAAVKSPFARKHLRHIDPIYKIQVSHGYEDYEGRFAEVLPEMDSTNLEIITKASGFYQWRYSERGAFYLCRNEDSLITTYFPEAFKVFEEYFKNKGFQIKLSSSGKLGTELLRNMGGILGINLLMSKEALEIIQLFDNGKAVVKRELFGIINRYRVALRVESPKFFIKSLLSKKIIEFGCEIQCSVCNQSSFYTSKELKDILLCHVCRNSYKLPEHDPDSIKWSYRGVGPFSRNNKADGLICVFLVLRFFKITLASINGAISPLLNFEMQKVGSPDREVDLALFYKEMKGSLGKPDLIFCECKTTNHFEKKDIDRMKQLGKEFPGAVLTFATLKEQLSDPEKELIRALCEYFRKGISERPLNPTLILTKSELTERFGMIAIEKLNSGQHLSLTDQLGHLADLTCQKYLGLESFGALASRRFQKMMEKNKGATEAAAVAKKDQESDGTK